jgi:thioredoxin-dependent peroxiredoxin
MPSLKAGDRAPDFHALSDDGSNTSLAGLHGRNVLIFFFPKALTPG